MINSLKSNIHNSIFQTASCFQLPIGITNLSAIDIQKNICFPFSSSSSSSNSLYSFNPNNNFSDWTRGDRALNKPVTTLAGPKSWDDSAQLIHKLRKFPMIDCCVNLNHRLLNGRVHEIMNAAKMDSVLAFIHHTVTPRDFPMAVNRFAEYPIFFSIGVPPSLLNDQHLNYIDEMKKFITSHPLAVVSIGKAGLFVRDASLRLNRQALLFEEHLQLASETNLPIFIHNDSVKSFPLFSSILANHPNVTKIVDYNTIFSMPSIIDEFANDPNVYYCALSSTKFYTGHFTDRLILQTMSPYHVPAPLASPFNIPSNIHINFHKIFSELEHRIEYGGVQEILARTILNNTLRLFPQIHESIEIPQSSIGLLSSGKDKSTISNFNRQKVDKSQKLVNPKIRRQQQQLDSTRGDSIEDLMTISSVSLRSQSSSRNESKGQKDAFSNLNQLVGATVQPPIQKEVHGYGLPHSSTYTFTKNAKKILNLPRLSSTAFEILATKDLDIDDILKFPIVDTCMYLTPDDTKQLREGIKNHITAGINFTNMTSEQLDLDFPLFSAPGVLPHKFHLYPKDWREKMVQYISSNIDTIAAIQAGVSSKPPHGQVLPLDFTFPDPLTQLASFHFHCSIAKQFNLPVVLFLEDFKLGNEMVKILIEEFPTIKVIVNPRILSMCSHFVLDQLLERGVILSTWPGSETIRKFPLDSILLQSGSPRPIPVTDRFYTDNPDLPNVSSHIHYGLLYAARHYQTEPSSISHQIMVNTMETFPSLNKYFTSANSGDNSEIDTHDSNLDTHFGEKRKQQPLM